MAGAYNPPVLSDADRVHFVIEFLRDCEFPRFGMRRGERWGYVLHEMTEPILHAIKTGGRFRFAGGQCLAIDVSLIYEGLPNLEYSQLMSTIPPTDRT
ncbi:hypothetical protein MBR110_31475 (plasmid) [Burkholderia sp. MBR-1]|nr:hypothetical protein MBR110_31475 [Burkholderia sp. MBR-1]